VNGVERIAAERKRQIEVEGWTAEHDEEHEDGELALAASLYAAPDHVRLFDVMGSLKAGYFRFEDPWPWNKDWDKRKKHSRMRRLEIAGALIAAEIDRLQALAQARAEEGWKE